MAEGMFIPDMVEEDEGGISAKHPNRFVLPLLVAPTHSDKPDTFNTVRHTLITIACKDVPDDHFEFDSSFVGAKARKAFIALHGTLKRHDFECPLGIWGHADPEGEVDYNQLLSERRAEAVYAILIRDLDTWERLYSSKRARTTRGGVELGDVWGDNAVRIILKELGFEYDEEKQEKLKHAIERYQKARKDAVTGVNDATLRKAIFMEYMQKLCVDANGTPYALSRNDFLGEGGKRGAFQGCSEFNPQLILAKAEADMYKKDKQFGRRLRHQANRDNRRVMIFFFEKGTRIDPDKWPCPRAEEGLEKCKSHLWSDEDARRNTQYDMRRRRFGKQVRNETDRMSRPEMTFGCRFYHGIAQRSPCERDLQMFAIQLLMDAPKEQRHDGPRQIPVPNMRFVAMLGQSTQSAVVRGRTSAQGMIGIPYLSPIGVITLKLDVAGVAVGSAAIPRTPEIVDIDVPNVPGGEQPGVSPIHADTDMWDDEEYFLTYTLRPDELYRIVKKPVASPLPDVPETTSLEPDADEPEVAPDERELGGRQRLYNLGYGSGLTEPWTLEQRRRYVRAFQRDHGIKPPPGQEGEFDDPTITELASEYGDLRPETK